MPSYNGQRVTDEGLVHTGKGYLTGYLASHEEISAQAVIFYDNTSDSGVIIHKVFIDRAMSPFFVIFRDGLAFSTGLYVNPGNCEVAVWASGK